MEGRKHAGPAAVRCFPLLLHGRGTPPFLLHFTLAAAPPSTAPVSVERARELLGTDLAALVGESYERAYADMLRVQQVRGCHSRELACMSPVGAEHMQLLGVPPPCRMPRPAPSPPPSSSPWQLTEVEEILAVKRGETAAEDAGSGHLHLPLPLQAGPAGAKALMQQMWSVRLKGVQRNVEVWQALLRCGGGQVAGARWGLLSMMRQNAGAPAGAFMHLSASAWDCRAGPFSSCPIVTSTTHPSTVHPCRLPAACAAWR